MRGRVKGRFPLFLYFRNRISHRKVNALRATEWGVCHAGVKGPFVRLKSKLPEVVHSRYSVIALCTHTFNFRTRFVDFDQLRTVYRDEGTLTMGATTN